MADPNTTNVGGIGGTIASILDLVNGFNGQGTNRGNTAAAMSDPFMGERAGYQKQLLGLMTDPSTFKMDPGAIFARDQGLEGVARYGNAMFGTTRSGNTADTLNRDATGYAAQQYNQRINQLMTLSGATTGSPAAAGGQYIRGNQANDQNLASGFTGIDQILGMLSNSGVGSAAMSAIKAALGMGGGGLGGNFTTNPNAWGGGGWNGTGDGAPGLGGDAPGSTGPQYDWGGDVIQDPWMTEPGFGDVTGGGDGFDWSNIDWSNWG
jgi:hypothetical protein